MSASSKALMKHYRAIAYWNSGLERITACYRASEIGLEFTSEERTKLHEALQLHERAKAIVTEIYGTRIGQAVTLEIRVEAQ